MELVLFHTLKGEIRILLLGAESTRLLTEKLDLLMLMASHCIAFQNLFFHQRVKQKAILIVPIHAHFASCSRFEQQVMETRPNVFFVLVVNVTRTTS